MTAFYITDHVKHICEALKSTLFFPIFVYLQVIPTSLKLSFLWKSLMLSCCCDTLLMKLIHLPVS